MRFAFIHAEKASFPVAALCRLFGVSRQGYYAYAARPAREPADRAAWEAERDRRTIEEIESRQKQFEDRLMSNYDRLRDEVMRLNKADLMNIKDERQRQREIDNLATSGVEALNEIELQEEEEAAARRVIAEAGDDDPRADDIDYQMELEIEAYKKQQQTRTTRRKEEE